MSLLRFLQTSRKAENDRPSSNVTTAPSQSLPQAQAGRDSVEQPDEKFVKNESSLTATIGIAEKSKVETTNYSKRSSGCPPNSHCINFVSILSDLR